MEIKEIKIQSLKNENPSLILNKDDFHSYNQNGKCIHPSFPDKIETINISTDGFEHILPLCLDQSIQNKYLDFSNCITGKSIPLPNVDTNFIPQGSCQVGDYTLIVAYDGGSDVQSNFLSSLLSSKKTVEKSNSLVYVVDKNGNLVRTVSLDGKYHCGSIAYEEESGSIYITGKSGTDGGNGCYINRYNVEDILNSNATSITSTNQIKVDDSNRLKSSTNGKSSAAYLNIYNHKIYVGNFSDNQEGIIKEYALNSNGTLDENSENIIKNPYDKTQGMCIYPYKGEDYYLFSTSYGRKNDSVIYVAKKGENGSFETVNNLTFPCMAEQINVCDNGDISILFESSAAKYQDASSRINDVCFLDFERLLPLEKTNVINTDVYKG